MMAYHLSCPGDKIMSSSLLGDTPSTAYHLLWLLESLLLGDTPSAYHLLWLSKSFFFFFFIRWYAMMAYHLLWLSESFFIIIIFLYSSFFLPEFVKATSISFHHSIIMKIIMIINIHMKLYISIFHENQSCMTSRRRHFVFFTLSHVIDHIFVTKCHFQNSLHRHNFQVII